MRSTVVVTAAAVGAVATGTLTALVPTPGEGMATSAAAGEPRVSALLSASTAPLDAAMGFPGFLTPVVFAVNEQDDGFATADQHLTLLGKASDLAAQLAETHARERRAQAERNRIAAVIKRGGLDGWVAEALQVMDLPQSLAPAVKRIIMAESGGDPHAVNTWDSNARRGTPSQGLMQTIPSTFRAYVHPALANRPITDPVANITAGLRYMIANYGLATVAAGGRSSDGNYVGY